MFRYVCVLRGGVADEGQVVVDGRVDEVDVEFDGVRCVPGGKRGAGAVRFGRIAGALLTSGVIRKVPTRAVRCSVDDVARWGLWRVLVIG